MRAEYEHLTARLAQLETRLARAERRRQRGRWITGSTLALALVAALAVPAFALSKASVGTWHLKKGAVAAKKIKGGAVTSHKIRNGHVKTRDLHPGAVGTGKLRPRANGTVLAAAFVAGHDGDVSNGFNRLGARPTATRAARGQYNVTIPGAEMSTTSIIHITHSGRSSTCNGRVDVRGGRVLVTCRSLFDDSLTNAGFNLALLKE